MPIPSGNTAVRSPARDAKLLESARFLGTLLLEARTFPEMTFSWRALLAALVLPVTSGAFDRFLPKCGEGLTVPDAFWSGAVTDSGLTPPQYFRNEKDGSGRPRYVLLVGAPGAGKSTWARAASSDLGWTFVACDEERLALLAEWRAVGRQVTSSTGRPVLADPADGSQYWDEAVVDEMIRRTQAKTRDALERKRPIVVEAAGPHLLPLRAARMSEANRAGYGVEALVFTADGPDGHVENTRTRHANGGTAPMPDLVKLRFEELAFFGNPFRVRPKHRAKEVVPEVVADFDWLERLPLEFASLAEALANLPPGRAADLRRYLDEDVFHRVDFVWVPAHR